MREYLIKGTGPVGSLLIHRDRVAKVLMPAGFDAVRVAGEGDVRLRVDEAEVSFTAEDFGWLVAIEGGDVAGGADQLVETVARQLEQATGTLTSWVRVT